MLASDLDFQFPEELIATTPQRSSRVVLSEGESGPREISKLTLFDLFRKGDVLAINNTQVLKRRVFAESLEVLFVHSENGTDWDVLFPARDYKIGDTLALPGGCELTLLTKGLPQKV